MVSINDDKVMDVSKPGKGKVVSTSRPVVVKTDTDKAPENAEVKVKETEAEKAPAPSVSHKVIQPLNAVEADKSEEEQPKSEAEEAPTSPEAVEEKKPEEPKEEPTTDGSAEAAGVDELAKAAESKKMASKQAEEQAKKDEELQKLIDSKKYFVDIKGASTKSSSNSIVVVGIITLLIIIGGYLLIDFGIFGSNIKLPYEFIKDDETTVVKVETATKEEKKSEAAANSTPVEKADDTDTKNELKNLQQKIDSYFVAEDTYPTSLDELSPEPTSDETTDSAGQKYIYESNGTSYSLSAQLSDGSTYTLSSAE